MKNGLLIFAIALSLLASLNVRSQNTQDSYEHLIPELTPVLHNGVETSSVNQIEALPSQISLPSNMLLNYSSSGYAAGEIDVVSGNSRTGAKTYSVPIKVAAGISESMTPRIALSYNSQQGGGILGTGWSLAGLSSVTRVSKSVYYDGFTEGVMLNCDDAFSLDGIRLIAIGNNGSEILYQTEQGNIKLKGYVQNDDILYFKAYYPDGRIGEFRTSASNSAIFPVAKVTDMHGNNIEFRYFYDQAMGVSHVIYNGNKIEFSYDDNVQERMDFYRGGKRFGLSSRLTEIRCYHKSSLIGKYSLNYTLSGAKALLSKVAYEAGDKELPPLKFYYNTAYNATVKLNSTSSLVYSFKNARIVKGRYDYGTGSDGIICLPEKNPYYRHFPQSSKYYYHNEYHPKDSIFIYQNVQTAYPDLIGILEAGDGLVDIFCADLTGNQTEDIIKVNNVVNGRVEKLTFSVYTLSSLGVHLRYKREYTLGTANDMSGLKSILPKFYHVGDFDGDGQMEIFAISANKAFTNNPQPSKCYIFELEEEPSSLLRYEGELMEYNRIFASSTYVSPQYMNNESDKLYVVDYDGDGKSDICHINEKGTDIYTFVAGPFGTLTGKKVSTYASIKKSTVKDRVVIPCDINGDGMTDLIVSSASGESSRTWSVRKGTGDGTFDMCTFNGPANNMFAEGYGFAVQDLNSDGVADLISTTPYSSSIFAGNCDGFSSTAFAQLIHSNDEDVQIIPTSLVSRNKFSNLLIYRHGNSKCTLSAYGCTVNESLQSLCVGMTNSLGVTEANTYTLATDVSSGICQKGYRAKYPFVNIYEPMPLLSQVRTTYRGEELSKETLHYGNPVIHRQGLGFQGFETVERTDYVGRRFSQRYDVYNRGALISEVSPSDSIKYEYDIVRKSGGIMQILPKQVRIRNLVDDIVTISEMSYDEYGNLTAKTIDYPDGAVATESYTYTNNDTATDGYYIGLPTSSTRTMKKGSSVLTDMVSVTSYDRGLPIGKKTMRNGLAIKEVAYEYYDNGLVKAETEKAYSSTKKFKISYSYTAEGRISQVIDPMGFTTVYTYYPENGLVKDVTDKTGKTEYSYDAFGREISRDDPVNPVVTTTYGWDTGRSAGHKMVTVSVGDTPSVTYYDPLNRPIQQVEKRIDGKLSAVTTQYDAYGNVKSVSYPHDATNAPSMNTEFTYDLLGRKLSETSPSGKRNTYSYGKLQSTETVSGVETTKTYDCRGNLIKIEDLSGYVTYDLGVDGQPERITAPGGAMTTFVYDNYRRLTSRTDPSIGKETFIYDADGNMKSQTNARGQTTTYTYDQFNRQISASMPEMTVNYGYDSYTGYLTAVTTSSGFSRSLSYDGHGRVIKSNELFDGKSVESRYHYADGLLQEAEHESASGFSVKESYLYTARQLAEIKLNDSLSVFKKNKVNQFGQVTETASCGMKTAYAYDEYGSLTGRRDAWGSEAINDVSLDFDPYNGNLLSRTDNRRGLTEQFSYDGLNRLTDYGGNYVDYSDNGNITHKSDAGAFGYTSSRPYALSTAMFSDAKIPKREQTATYASFMRPLSISENKHAYLFAYGPDFNRIKMQCEHLSSWTLKRYYLGGNYEFDDVCLLTMAEIVDPGEPVPEEPFLPGTFSTGGELINPGIGGGDMHKRQDFYDVERFYIGGDAYTAPAVLVKDTFDKGSLKLYLIVRDHVGSIVALVNADGGKVVQELSYDAWGRMRDPETHEVYASGKEPTPILGRGYGSHEYLRDFGLVNMNARLYDPILGRFLSPDPYVQDPTLPQNFNRYSYCLNNPLLYCDQSGEWFGLDDLFIAAVGFMTGYLSNAISSGNWGWSSVKAGLMGAGMCWLGYNTAGLATGAITSGTLTHAGTIGLSTLTANITPSVGFKIGEVTIGISINPLIGLGTGGFTYGMGLGVSASYKELCVGAGYGIGYSGATSTNSLLYRGWNVCATVNDYGLGYGKTMYSDGYSPNGAKMGAQTLGNFNAYLDKWSVTFSNDCLGDKQDRWRTNAIEISWNEFSIGSYVDTNWGEKESTDFYGSKEAAIDKSVKAGVLSTNAGDRGAWKIGNVHFAPLWIGYRQGNLQYRLGYSHRYFQNMTQNLIHKTPLGHSQYYRGYDFMKTGPFFYVGSVNPFSIWTY